MSLVASEDRDAVRHVVLNRPEKRNALSGAVVDELGTALRAAAADPGVRVVVLRGEGPVFSSGMDTADLAELAANPSRLHDWRAASISVRPPRTGARQRALKRGGRRSTAAAVPSRKSSLPEHSSCAVSSCSSVPASDGRAAELITPFARPIASGPQASSSAVSASVAAASSAADETLSLIHI